MTDEPSLLTEGLAKSYGDLDALFPLDLQIGRGEGVALVGHNGSGKSTLLKLISGLLEPTEGRAEVCGSTAGTLEARAALSYLPDDPVLYDDLSVREHVEYLSRLHGGEGWDEWADDLVHRLGLAHRVDDLPARFSRGLRQKTAILLAMTRPFDLLVVDEPFVGLDAGGKATLLELLEEVRQDGATILVATHEEHFVERVDRCLALRDGELIHDGPASPAEVLDLVS